MAYFGSCSAPEPNCSAATVPPAAGRATIAAGLAARVVATLVLGGPIDGLVEALVAGSVEGVVDGMVAGGGCCCDWSASCGFGKREFRYIQPVTSKAVMMI